MVFLTPFLSPSFLTSSLCKGCCLHLDQEVWLENTTLRVPFPDHSLQRTPPCQPNAGRAQFPKSTTESFTSSHASLFLQSRLSARCSPHLLFAFHPQCVCCFFLSIRCVSPRSLTRSVSDATSTWSLFQLSRQHGGFVDSNPQSTLPLILLAFSCAFQCGSWMMPTLSVPPDPRF